MAIIDWPTTRPFTGALFSLGLDVSESAYTGFLTGNRTRRSNLADRLRGTLTLPPCADPVAGAAREALLLGLRSTGDLLRMAVPHRRYPLGTLRGAPVVSVSAAAGARSFSIAGGTAGVNLLSGSGFEIDTNADGVADQWAAYTTTAGAVTRGLFAGALISQEAGLAYQSVNSAALNGAAGCISDGVPVAAGRVYTASAAMAATTGAACVISIAWKNAGGAYISESQASHSATLGRRSVTASAPVGATSAQVVVFAFSVAGTAVDFSADNAQLELGSVPTPFAGFPSLVGGDWVSVGGNLLMVGYAGATMSDAGAGTVPLTLPLQRPLSSSAPVTWVSPTGLWELDDDGLQLDYSAGLVQGGVAIPLRQVSTPQRRRCVRCVWLAKRYRKSRWSSWALWVRRSAGRCVRCRWCGAATPGSRWTLQSGRSPTHCNRQTASG
jgi:hypothetical protein